MHRWFDVSAAKHDLGFEPIVPFDDGWKDTLEWFKRNWLPTFDPHASITGLSTKTQDKIDVQAAGTGRAAKKNK